MSARSYSDAHPLPCDTFLCPAPPITLPNLAYSVVSQPGCSSRTLRGLRSHASSSWQAIDTGASCAARPPAKIIH